MYCNYCSSPLEVEWKFCPSCQTPIVGTGREGHEANGSIVEGVPSLGNFEGSEIKRVWDGDAGLAFTYWGVAVGGNFIFKILSLVGNEGFEVLLGLAAIPFWIFVSVSVWRAASKYSGSLGWAFAAKAMVVLGTFAFLVGFLGGLA
jgi:hypothetical protein